MIQLADRFHCTGCSSCYNVCPHHAIKMQADIDGFLQPCIDTNICVECGLCVKRCPALNPLEHKETNPIAYAFISHSDCSISSSGGAFSVFARWILSEGGIVYGASMDEKMQIQHVGVETVEDLCKLRGSKYVQSEIGTSYQEIKTFLKNGRKVLFTGTPCQVAGLYKYLGRKYEDLLVTLDLVCHGVPSQSIFNMYLQKLKETYPKSGEIVGFNFRKLTSWSIIPTIKFQQTKWKSLFQADNVYMEAFFHGWTYRECCFNCQYANMDRIGTFTIADFWGIGKHGAPFNKNISSGVSLVIDNSNQMTQLIPTLSKYAYIEKRSIEEALFENHNLKGTVKREEIRDAVIEDFLNPKVPLKEIGEKYHLIKKENLRFYCVELIKYLINRLGLYNIYKTISYKIK